jgi:outer membrane protein assembly factor BamE (lipoprotein component of BamABCDE complex)
MRKKLVWTTTATIMLVGIVGYWVLSGFSMGGTMTYDLTASAPSQYPRQSWRRKAAQLLLPLLYSHDTRYAALYREEAFRSVRPGVTEEEIRTALGDPLEKTRLEDGRFMWHYTKPGPKTQDFLVRIVEFDAARRVLRIHAEFYVD